MRCGATNFCLTVAARSARFTWLATSLGSKTANTIASRPKPSLIPPFGSTKLQSLERVAKSDKALIFKILGMTTDNLQHVENHLLLLGRQTSLERVAAFLVEMGSSSSLQRQVSWPFR